MKKRKGRNSLLVPFVAVVLAVYAIYSTVSIQAQVRAKRAENQLLQEERDLRAQRVERLQDELDAPLDDASIARLAREKLGLVQPGERVFIDISR